MKHFCIIFTSLCVFILSKVVFSKDVPPLRGLTVLRAPFVVRDADGKLSGYLIDLLNELASIGKFNYTLEAIEQEALYESTPTVINELYRQQADFAIADNLIRSSNSYFVNYTEPYFVSGLSVLVRKSELTARNISTIEHLLQWKPENETKLKEITIGTSRFSDTYRILSMSKDKIGRQVVERMQQETQLYSREDGITCVLNSTYTLIQEAFNNELDMDANCQLTQLLLQPESIDKSSTNESPQLELSIAVLKDTANGHTKRVLDILNQAIIVMKQNDQLYKLRHRYWN